MLAPYNHLWHIFTWGHIPCLEGDAARRAFDALDKVAAHLRSNRLLVKPGPSAVCMMPDARYALPYEEATVLSQADPHWIAAESAVPAFLRGLLIFSHAVGLMRPPKPEREKWIPTLVVTFMIIRLEDSVMFEDNAAKEIGQPQKL